VQPWPVDIGARALGLAEVTGSLTEGKKADLIMLRADDLNLGPLNVADGQILLAAQPRNVDTVWVDGVVRTPDDEARHAYRRALELAQTDAERRSLNDQLTQLSSG